MTNGSDYFNGVNEKDSPFWGNSTHNNGDKKEDSTPPEWLQQLKDFADHNKKAFILIVLGDLIWQAGAQWLDTRFEDDSLDGEFLTIDLLAILYPIVVGLLIYGIAKSTKADPDLEHNVANEGVFISEDNQPKLVPSTKPLSPIEISLTVGLGIMGWTVGYYVADYYEMDDWETAAMVGGGSAVAALLFTLGKVVSDRKRLQNEDTNNPLQPAPDSAASIALKLLAALVFAAGAGVMWDLAYMAPELIHGEDRHPAANLWAIFGTVVGTGAMTLFSLKSIAMIDKKYAHYDKSGPGHTP